MKKSTIIAMCLVNSRISVRIEDAESLIKHEFDRYFPNDDFNKWNSDVDDDRAKHIIGCCGVAKEIDIELFIQDLRNE